ncbi:beta-glucosidase [Clostridium sp. DSM 8431]|uniref:glycoside hydrolase family 3 C-terminal domain-containing protein n=1 Tax=Clostridium sp. DSM 8431 TaxID=1761781 RepID=UPI0008F323CA|nr:glycoside hydrolase family 3 C-terminal domain-containing protein [Clostridium sp. DSM 8431]SFU39865.1 beta-glucosidase [Clostridium sp. DSM 8431]
MNIEDIISKLTLEEKVSMCHGAGLFRTEGVKRLNIPALKMSDGPMGVRHEFPDASWVPVGNSDDYVTYMPCIAALAATWNTELAYDAGDVIGSEARARGKDMILGPGINIVRSPLCGRNFEYMSEDPFLAGKMAVSYIRGVQEKNDVSACVKHFAVNSQETERLEYEAIIDERTLREIYFPAFEAAVKEGNTYSVMTAYNKIFGYYCSHNKELIKGVLEDEWGFEGITVSDWGAVRGTVEAANAGLDIEMNVRFNFDEYFFANPLIEAVKEGKVKETEIDEKVRRILKFMYKINIFSEGREAGEYNTPDHRQKALNIARESIVLLKNNKILPFNKNKIKKIAVIGENANVAHSNGGGSAEIKALYEVTPLLGIKMALGGNTEVKYYKGYSSKEEEQEDLLKEAILAAKEADAVIFVGGLKHVDENLGLEDNALKVSSDEAIKHRIDSEGYDRSDLLLPYNQNELIKSILNVNKNTAVVILSGSPIDATEWIDSSEAVVQTWYNGIEGGTALGEVLFGKVNPSGKLTVTYPKQLEDSPAHSIGEFAKKDKVNYKEGIFVGYRYFSTYDVEPLFCFGHGLSYTNFEYKNIDVTVDEKEDDVSVLVKFDLSNIGDMEGKEISQVYVGDINSSVKRPIKELKGFNKVNLLPGETKTVTVSLDKRAFAFYDETKRKWNIESGEFKIMVGSSVQDIKLSQNISIKNNYIF